MKKKIHEIALEKEDFKDLKKNKKLITIELDKDGMKEIEPKDKIHFILKDGKKVLKKKVRKIHRYSSLEELLANVKKQKLGLKKNEQPNYEKLNDQDMNKYGVIGIEVKPKLTFMKVIFVILCIILVGLLFTRVDGILKKKNDEKINRALNELYEDKIGYVFIEINPSLVFTTKGDKVIDVTCLNDDCKKMENGIDVEGKSLTDSVESIYNLAKDRGFDTSTGVKIKSSESIQIDNKLNYVTVEYLPKDEEQKMLESVEDKTIVKNDNDTYYTELWEKLKKDSRYDEVYTCNMDSGKLECYLKEEFIRPLDGILEESSPVTKALQIMFFNQITGIKETLDKFDIPNTFGKYAANMGDDTNQIILNGIKFQYVLDYTYNGTNIRNACYYRGRPMNCTNEYECFRKPEEKAFALKDMDLLNPTAVLGRLIIDENN